MDKTYTSNWQPDANGNWAPVSARVFIHPAAMRIADVLRIEKATGRRTKISRFNYLELVPKS